MRHVRRLSFGIALAGALACSRLLHPPAEPSPAAAQMGNSERVREPGADAGLILGLLIVGVFAAIILGSRGN